MILVQCRFFGWRYTSRKASLIAILNEQYFAESYKVLIVIHTKIQCHLNERQDRAYCSDVKSSRIIKADGLSLKIGVFGATVHTSVHFAINASISLDQRDIQGKDDEKRSGYSSCELPDHKTALGSRNEPVKKAQIAPPSFHRDPKKIAASENTTARTEN